MHSATLLSSSYRTSSLSCIIVSTRIQQRCYSFVSLLEHYSLFAIALPFLSIPLIRVVFFCCWNVASSISIVLFIVLINIVVCNISRILQKTNEIDKTTT
uniref:NADH dehydrogenase subunit 4L n=1 Tax=Panagrolaimus sp. ES5 TaxID=591445 RepID=A0AC34GRC5_9BILA